MKKLYIVEYSTKCKHGSRSARKLVETEDIESYIKSNFLLGYSYSRGAKMFISATEVRKANAGVEKYMKVDGGTRWYAYPITFIEHELRSAIQRACKGECFNSKLQKFWCLADDATLV